MTSQRDWKTLSKTEQTKMLEEHQHWLDQLPATQSEYEKNRRLIQWPAERNVSYA